MVGGHGHGGGRNLGFVRSRSGALGAAGGRSGSRALARRANGVHGSGSVGVGRGSSRLSQLKDRGPTGSGKSGVVVADQVDGADAVPVGGADEDGTLFDPLSPDVLEHKVDRGPEEDPSAVHDVDFLKEEGGVHAGEDSVLSFPATGNIDGAEGTINMVIEPDWNGSDEGSRSLLVVGEKNEWKNRIRVVKNNNYLRAMHFDSTGTERGLGIEINNWKAGEQHQVTVGWSKKDQLLALFVDGAKVAERPLDGEIVFGSAATIEVGSAANREYRGAASSIFDLTTHDRMLTPGDL